MQASKLGKTYFQKS